jgi:uncharacterized membrane protein
MGDRRTTPIVRRVDTMTVIVLILRVAHVVSGLAWVGALLFTKYVLMPTVRATVPDGPQFLGHLAQHMRLQVYMMVAADIAILSGLLLYARALWLAPDRFLTSHSGMMLTLGGVAALLAIVAGRVIAGPSTQRLRRLSDEIRASERGPSPDEERRMNVLRRRMHLGSRSAVWLAAFAAVTMAAARYL